MGDRPAASRAPTLRHLIEARLSRREALGGLAAAGLVGLVGCATATPQRKAGDLAGRQPGDLAGLTFTEVPRVLDEKLHVAPGYAAQVLLRAGDPILPGAPPYVPGSDRPDDQERQFGTDNDFIAFMPLPLGSESSARGLLVVNHENHRARLMWPGLTGEASDAAKITRERSEVQMAAQGLSIVEIARTEAGWAVAGESPYTRRVSARSTRIRVSGPAAGHPRLGTREDPAGRTVVGTFNNCAGGVTPWGTVLSGEENFNFYFVGDAARGPEAAARKRYGITGRGRYVWGRHVDRFHLDREPNEPNRFGWVVEVDPYDPASVPVKRTALGRFKHEGATTALCPDGRVAVYSGDDERMEYVYRFVTRRAWDQQSPEANRDLLDDGILSVARFEADGTMRWLPLVFGEGPLTPARGFRSQAEVVIEARRAADLVGATPMDRPEDIEAHPATGRVYVVLTYNERRKPGDVNPANPRGPNRFGHILELAPPLVDGRPDHAADAYRWEFFLLGGDPRVPAHGARYQGPVSDRGWLAAPDNLAFDPRGRLWITTDGQDDVAGFADSVYAVETAGPARGVTRGFLSAPRGAEIAGPAFTPDGRTLFLAIQHPGDEPGSTFDRPSTRWPDFLPGVPPRSAVIAVTRPDGGEIGG